MTYFIILRIIDEIMLGNDKNISRINFLIKNVYLGEIFEYTLKIGRVDR